MSILLVDDHELVREGVARLLGDAPDMVVVGQLSSGEEVLEYISHADSNDMNSDIYSTNNIYRMPDIILLDARMPGLGGIEATREILKLAPECKVVAMSSVASGVIPSQMLRSGAKGFITKSVPVEELLKAIRVVNEGDHYVTPSVATRLAVDPFGDDGGGGLFDKLSRRELQIAQMLTDGKKVSQISIYLGLSPKTVYSYRYRIFEKLGIRSDVELTILAVKHGLADDTREYDGLPSFDSIVSFPAKQLIS
ncbi:MAG: DNA-binding response regulator [SAR86 cluster bacterium]|uniref:DNA-binding response regulator n=1 Tax=SAR86 cluster bacterium TaxID=2030880 RepID=A0A2A4X1I0_9GAMM|nr:MAG: DNA-binding response regulator [SAR86 cluster bacterium]